MNRPSMMIAKISTALLAGIAVLMGLATGTAAAAAHHTAAKPTLTVAVYPRSIVYGAEGHVLLELSGSHGRVHGEVSLSGLGGNCNSRAAWLNQHKHMKGHKNRRLPSDFCTTRHYFKEGPRTLTAKYYGSKKYRARIVHVTFHVVKDHNKLTVSASPKSPVAAGTSSTFTATLLYDGGSTVGSPQSGTISFRTEDGPIAGCQHVKPNFNPANPTATCTATLPAGKHTVEASFSGTTHFKSSSGSTSYTVKP